MSAARRRLKHFLYAAFDAVGLIAFWRWLHRDNLTCLVIHGIGTPAEGDAWTPVRWRLRKERLDEYLGILKKHYAFVDVETAVRIVRGEERVRYPLLLTIDDGYSNAVSDGVPIFRKHGIRPVVFVVADHAETQEPFWFDRFDFALQKVVARGMSTSVEPLDAIISRCGGDLSRAARAYINWTRQNFADDRLRRRHLDQVVTGLEAAAGTRLTGGAGDRWASVMSAEDVRRALQSGVDIGSHTVHHYRLGDVPDDVVETELKESRAAIERMTGAECRTFCFPEGSLHDGAKRLAREAGYDCAFTSAPGLNPPGCDPMSLKRIHLPPHEPRAALLARICGLEMALHAAAGKIRRTTRRKVKGRSASLATG